MFRPVESSTSFPQLEERIIRFWKERQIYHKSLELRRDAPRFVFFEGPPTANGLPHPGHCLTRSIKDLFPRYRTMRGYRCDRKAGWDTHGLPVEVEVSKQLGIHSKEEIEQYGVKPFIQQCIESVFRYTKEWEELTERLGFWVDLNQAYVTFHQSYVESVWWSLKHLFDRGLLYQGYKIVWWWAQGGTSLSAGEVGLGYREVADPSVFVRFPLVDRPNTDLLVWTTTPWTLPSNQFAAVKPDLAYSVVQFQGDSRAVIVATALVDALAAKVKKDFALLDTLRGEEMIGWRYVPPFDYYYRALGNKQGTLRAGGKQHIAWRVVAAEFVTVDTGSGVVHQAPAFGEVDFDVLQAERDRFVEGEGPGLICSVAANGTFSSEAPGYEGRWVKEADRDIARRLRDEGKLFHQEQYLHEYPFCWRAEEDPLIQYPRKSWFIRTTRFREMLLANNRQIQWLPEHIRDGRFGNFLESNVDWSLSRERYWGTPLPIWVCEKTGYTEAIGSYAELLAKPGVAGTEVWEEAKRENPALSDHLKVHKPYIDAVTYDSPKAPGSRMRRVSEVIDCWYDSGAMPFAQWGYPHQVGSQARFWSQFPADFISEALDQTRGWFYSLLAISTLLFSEDSDRNGEADTRATCYPHPFRNCIVLGLMLGEDGQKMSKSKRNYREPKEIFDRYGADALRWFFFAAQPPWTSIRYAEQAIRDVVPEFLLRFWNTYSFFVIYANIDGFDPAAAIAGDAGDLGPDVLARAGGGWRPAAQRSELDRWILSELSRTASAVIERMDAYDNYTASMRLNEFLDALSNWYVRRSRDRFWSGNLASPEKADAYWTLYECLLTFAKLVAPFVPFVAEEIWQNLAVAPFGERVRESVHLCDYPKSDPAEVDEALSTQMNLVREIVSLGRAARMDAKLKVRQPLARVEVVLAGAEHQEWLEEHAALVADELNIKQVEFTRQGDQYITYTVLPDLKKLGPKLGKRLPLLRKALGAADGGKLLAELETSGQVTLALPDGPLVLASDDIQVRLQAKPGWAAAQGRQCVVVLSTELTGELIQEGFAREIMHTVQTRRKDLGLEFTDRIEIGYQTESAELRQVLEAFAGTIAAETLAVSLEPGAIVGVEGAELKVGGHAVTLYVKKHENVRQQDRP